MSGRVLKEEEAVGALRVACEGGVRCEVCVSSVNSVESQYSVECTRDLDVEVTVA